MKYTKLKEISETLNLVLIVVYGISKFLVTNLGDWNLIPGILALINFLVTIYVLTVFHKSNGTWKGSGWIWGSLFSGLALIFLFFHFAGLI